MGLKKSHRMQYRDKEIKNIQELGEKKVKGENSNTYLIKISGEKKGNKGKQ
jgi:hypothetical protein